MNYIGVKKIKQRLDITSKKLRDKRQEKTVSTIESEWNKELSIKELTAMLEKAKRNKDLKSSLAIIKELNDVQGNESKDKVTTVTVVLGGNSNTVAESNEIREERVRKHLIKEGMLK